jgi:hypothetical protein
MLDPRWGLGCLPETVPSIGRRAESGKLASLESTPWSRKLRCLRSGNIDESDPLGCRERTNRTGAASIEPFFV